MHSVPAHHQDAGPAGSGTDAAARFSSTLWQDEKTVCFQVYVKGVLVARRSDNDMVNGTKLLNLCKLTRGKRDSILKNQPARRVIKTGTLFFKGVWIKFERARALAAQYNILLDLYPLFEDKASLERISLSPENVQRTAAVMAAARHYRLVSAAASVLPTGSSACLGRVGTADAPAANTSTMSNMMFPPAAPHSASSSTFHPDSVETTATPAPYYYRVPSGETGSHAVLNRQAPLVAHAAAGSGTHQGPLLPDMSFQPPSTQSAATCSQTHPSSLLPAVTDQETAGAPGGAPDLRAATSQAASSSIASSTSSRASPASPVGTVSTAATAATVPAQSPLVLSGSPTRTAPPTPPWSTAGPPPLGASVTCTTTSPMHGEAGASGGTADVYAGVSAVEDRKDEAMEKEEADGSTESQRRPPTTPPGHAAAVRELPLSGTVADVHSAASSAPLLSSPHGRRHGAHVAAADALASTWDGASSRPPHPGLASRPSLRPGRASTTAHAAPRSPF